jgi:hypothetical protein
MAQVVNPDVEVETGFGNRRQPDPGAEGIAGDRCACRRREQQIVPPTRWSSMCVAMASSQGCRTANVRGSLSFGYGLTIIRSPVGESLRATSTIVSSTVRLRRKKSM